MINFKESHLIGQWNNSPAVLKFVVLKFCEIAKELDKTVTITRITDRVDGESGVHPSNRAVDIRNEYAGNKIYNPHEVKIIVDRINKMFPRLDGKLTIIHHSFNDGPEHFHLQVPALSTSILFHPISS